MVFKKLSKLITVIGLPLLLGAELNAINNNNFQSVKAETNYKQKIVSVVYDNSGSMGANNKRQYAQYSMKMLASLLDNRDTLVVTRMNQNGSLPKTIEFDLTADREQEIKNKFSDSFLDANSGTPPSVLNDAIRELTKRGMKTVEDYDSDVSKEYWLVVLTDGVFDGIGNVSELMCDTIKPYANLKSIYYSMCESRANIQNTDFTNKYPGYAFYAEGTKDIIAGMKQVANLVTGRLIVDNSYITKTSNTTVDINLKPLEFAISNLSVIAQNSSAKLTSASYGTSNIQIQHPVSFTQTIASTSTSSYLSNLNIKDDYFSGDKLTLTFDGNISSADFSILAEPALYIDSYIEAKSGSEWKRVDVPYINQYLREKDVIRTGYVVKEAQNHTEVNIKKIFGTPEEKVTYNGNNYQMFTGQIPLVNGSKELSISVSIMNGAYIMSSAQTIIIEADPTDYRVEGSVTESYQGDTNQALFSFQAYANKAKLLPSNFTGDKAYSYTIECWDPEGNVIQPVTPPSMDSSGVIKVFISNKETRLYGKYKVKCSVTNYRGLKRDTTLEGNFLPPPTPSDFAVIGESQSCYQGNENEGLFTFYGFAKGNKLMKSDYEGIDCYKYEVVVKDSNGSTIQPAKLEMLGDGTIEILVSNASSKFYGVYTATCTLTSAGGVKKSLTKEANFYPPTPVDFNVEGKVTPDYKGDEEIYLVSYEASAGGNKLGKDAYSGFGAYKYEVFVTNPNGASVQPEKITLEEDGTINVVISAKATKLYGNYVSAIKVTSATGVLRENTQNVEIFAPTPAGFRVEGNVTQNYQGIENQALLKFVGYGNGVQLSKTDFEGDKSYTYKVEATNPSGSPFDPVSTTMNQDGSIEVIVTSNDSKIYGEYKVKVTILTAKGSEASLTLSVTFYPPVNSVKVELDGPEEISITQNQLKTNTKGYSWKVTSDGNPLYVDSKAFICTITIGGVDVSDKAEIKGNEVIFIPNVDTLPASLQSVTNGSKDVNLTINPSENTSIKYQTDKLAKYSITNTVYIVTAIDSNQKEFDRYEVNRGEAILYFSVEIDGIILNEQELQEALDNGELQIDGGALFDWLVYMTCSFEKGVTTFNGTPVVYLKAKSNWPGFLANLFGSFIFPNGKTVTANMCGVKAKDSFVITPVDIVSRLWRYAVILITLAFIVHVICYLIGFKVAKPLPHAVIVRINLDTGKANSTVAASIRATPYNIGMGEIVKWHLFRFIPFCEFKYQKLECPVGGVDIFRKKGAYSASVLVTNKRSDNENRKVKYDQLAGTEAQIKFQDFLNKTQYYIQNYKTARFIKSFNELKSRDVREFFNDDVNTTYADEKKTQIIASATTVPSFIAAYVPEGSRPKNKIIGTITFVVIKK